MSVTSIKPAHLLTADPELGVQRTAGDRVRLYGTLLLVVCSLLAWRAGEYYSGGVDPVVAAKALLASVALVLALGQYLKVRPSVGLGPWTPVLIVAYIVVTWLGGWADGTLVTSGVLGARVLITAATVGLIALAYPSDELLRAAVLVFGAIGTLAALSGIGSLATRGRLYGELIPVNPNQIALLLAPPIIWLVWQMLREPCRSHHVVCLVALVALTLLTGSRTGIIAIFVAVVILMVQAVRLPIGACLALLAMIPVAFYIFVFTGAVGSYVNRDGTGNVTTLNSRTIAWAAVFNAPTNFWDHWFGGGLAVKTVSVTGQYWSEQVLDSSWVSAYAQAGVIGVCLMAGWALVAVFAARRAPRQYRGLLTALIVYALIRSALENGLIDSFVLFVAMLLPTLVAELHCGETRRSG